MRKTALIAGVTGQIGSYLAELLLGKGYRVVGITRRQRPGPPMLDAHTNWPVGVDLQVCNIAQWDAVTANVIRKVQPDEVYNFAGQSCGNAGKHDPMADLYANSATAINVFKAVAAECPTARVFQASSSRVFGRGPYHNLPCWEETPRAPVCPYGASKQYADTMADWFRRERGLWVASGVLFSHESPRRRPDFVSRKLSRAAARIKLGLEDSVTLDGSLDARRDWGFAGDAARAAWLMLQQAKPQDCVIGTGRLRSVRDLAETAFSTVGLDWQNHVKVDPDAKLGSGAELRADYQRIRGMTGWQPTVGFEEMISAMVKNDLRLNTQ